MKNGTLAEKRTLTTTTTAVPTTTETPKAVTTEVVKIVEEQPTLKQPDPTIQTVQVAVKEPKKEQKCTYCKAKDITTLAIRGSIVLVLLALCFNLIKTATK